MIDKLKSEPAVVIGAIAAVLLAAAQYLGGHNLLSGDVVNWIVTAFHVPSDADPSTGWAIPIIVALVTRFFVSPAANPGV